MSKRMFMTLTEDEYERFEDARNQLGMYRSQYLKYLIQGQKEIRPVPITQQKIISAMSGVERNLKILAMKDTFSDEERLYIMEQIKDMKSSFEKLSNKK